MKIYAHIRSTVCLLCGCFTNCRPKMFSYFFLFCLLVCRLFILRGAPPKSLRLFACTRCAFSFLCFVCLYFFCNRFGWFCCSNFIVVGVSIRKNTVREQLFVVFISSLGQFTQTISTSNNCNNSQNSLVVSFVKQNESFFFSSSSV